MLMILTLIAYFSKMLELTEGQGHKVKSQGQICTYKKSIFCFRSLTDEWMLEIPTFIIDIGQMV